MSSLPRVAATPRRWPGPEGDATVSRTGDGASPPPYANKTNMTAAGRTT